MERVDYSALRDLLTHIPQLSAAETPGDEKFIAFAFLRLIRHSHQSCKDDMTRQDHWRTQQTQKSLSMVQFMHRDAVSRKCHTVLAIARCTVPPP